MDGPREYTANFYRGCSHGCVYCYAPSLIHDDREWGGFVDVKVNAPAVLGRELKGVRKGVVFLSSASDPYQPAEARYKVTRSALEALLQNDFPVVILTRSPLILRDLDLLKRFSWLRVGFSISSLPGRLYEPGVAPIDRRIESLRILGAAGVKTWVSMAPLVSGMMGIDIRELLDKLRAAGVSSVSAGMLRFQGYGESKEMFERVSGVAFSEVSAGAEATLAEARRLIDEFGFEQRASFFEWKPEGGLDRYLSEEARGVSTPIS
ncbi:MAG: radical SAM protein [Thaumarchaeota archaeon]|nr:radical SAM protein [Nitrososphaerota archaeon]